MRSHLARSALVVVTVAVPFASFASFAGCTSPTLPVGVETQSMIEAGNEAGNTAAVGSLCEAAHGTCVLGSVTCATQAPSSAQDCNPELNPGGSFCCLTSGAGVGCDITTSGGPGPGANEAYTGDVTAIADLTNGQSAAKNEYQLSMEYYLASEVSLPDAAFMTSGCSCHTGVDDPFENSFSGTVTLESGAGATLATLSATSTHHGWTPGQTLEVCAKGDAMNSFSGSLRTAPLPSGISPPIGATPSVVHENQGFTVSWKPDSGGDDQVTVRLGQQVSPDIVCTCTAPDSAGSVTFDSTLLSQFDTDASPGPFISFIRSTTSTLHTDEANIQLRGKVAIEGSVKFE